MTIHAFEISGPPIADVIIENPILNSPFREPTRHFKFDDEGITNEIVEGRRISSYFVPIAQPRKKGKQLVFDTEWTQDSDEPKSPRAVQAPTEQDRGRLSRHSGCVGQGPHQTRRPKE